MLRITGGTIYDPANGINGEVRDLYIADGKFSSKFDAGRTIDATGMVIMPGGVDVHTHVAGGSINSSMTPEDHRRTHAVIRSKTRQHWWYGTHHFATGYLYAEWDGQRSKRPFLSCLLVIPTRN